MFQPLQMLPPRLRCHLLKLIGLRQNYTTCLPPAPHRSWRYAASAVAAAVAAAVPATTCRYLRGLGGDASSGCTPRHPSSSSRNAAIHPYGDLNARRGKFHQCPKAAAIFGMLDPTAPDHQTPSSLAHHLLAPTSRRRRFAPNKANCCAQSPSRATQGYARTIESAIQPQRAHFRTSLRISSCRPCLTSAV